MLKYFNLTSSAGSACIRSYLLANINTGTPESSDCLNLYNYFISTI